MGAVINSDEDDDLTGNVRLGTTDHYFSCSGSAQGVNNYDCTYQHTPPGDFIPGVNAYTINVYSDDALPPSSPAVSRTVNVIIDNREPVIESFSIAPPTTSDGVVNLAYGVRDYAFINSNLCSGIKKVEFYEAGTIIGDLTQTYGASGCWIATSPVQYTHEGTGVITLCMKAYDRLNQVSEEACEEFTIDKEGPNIFGDTLTVTHRDGSELNYYKGTVDARLSINITTEDLDKSSVIADLSELTGSLGDKAKIRDSCTDLQDGITECKWDFRLNLVQGDSAQPKTVKVNASVYVGNSLEVS